jgi:hypothetical protein
MDIHRIERMRLKIPGELCAVVKELNSIEGPGGSMWRTDGWKRNEGRLARSDREKDRGSRKSERSRSSVGIPRHREKTAGIVSVGEELNIAEHQAGARSDSHFDKYSRRMAMSTEREKQTTRQMKLKESIQSHLELK